MTRAAQSTVVFFALSVSFTVFAATVAAQGEQEQPDVEAPATGDDASAGATAEPAAEDTAPAEEAPAVESAAATEAAAQAEAPIAAPAPAAAYPVPEPAPSANEGVVYAPPAGANHYPAPQLAAPRRHWPRAGEFGFMVAYAPSIAVGSSSDFASNFGFRGFALGVRYMMTEAVSIGLESGWAFQDDKSRETHSVEGPRRTLTVTSGQIRSTEIIPITASAHYYYDAGSVIPHAGLALGAYYSRRDLDAGLWYFNQDGWHFGFAPEVGIIIPTGTIQVLTAVRFNYLVEAGDMPEEMYFEFRIGILGF